MVETCRASLLLWKVNEAHTALSTWNSSGISYMHKSHFIFFTSWAAELLTGTSGLAMS